MLDTVLGLAVIYLTFSLPFAIWMIRGFSPDSL
jgi:ABC-type glycerol-3-phosphate transport system permease component